MGKQSAVIKACSLETKFEALHISRSTNIPSCVRGIEVFTWLPVTLLPCQCSLLKRNT